MVKNVRSAAEQIATWRLSIIGRLLSDPPEVVKHCLLNLVKQGSWRHPVSGEKVDLKLRTLQRWYFVARTAANPFEALKPAVRKDTGRSHALSDDMKALINILYNRFPHFSWLLLLHNLEAEIRSKGPAGHYIPSYSTFRRYMMKQGLRPVPRKPTEATQAIIRTRKTGSFLFEVEHVGALWHNDYHHGKFRVVTSNGTLRAPIAAAFIDDRSRFICHIQWFLNENCENLSHTLSQAIMRRGLPRRIVNDNGSPMIAQEFISGGENLGIMMHRIRKFSPWENGKIESFWKPLEGRLISMLHGVQNLTLAELNLLTQVWVEQEYHRSYHSEIKSTPLEVFLKHKSVLREPPTLVELERAFRVAIERQQRMTDHTITVDGVRYQIPQEFWHQRKLRIAYARWNLSSVDILNDETGRSIATLKPVDKLRNAEIATDKILSIRSNIEDALPPLLREQYQKSKIAGNMSPYLPKEEHE